MVSVKVVALAGLAGLLTTVANAADLPQYRPAPVMVPYEQFSGWYLRGDIGMSNQRVGSLFNALYASVDSVNTVQKEFDSAPTFGIGLGYQFNNWFRMDVTGEYRGKANFHGLDIARVGASTYTDQYTASKSEWVVLANVYFDLGTWYRVTPFVGVGVGGAYNTISSFTDTCAIVSVCTGGSVATGVDTSKWNLAWALHAGLSYKVTPTFTVELSYRYLNIGNAMSGDLVTYLGTSTINNPMEFRNITSHDVRLGIRWLLAPPEPVLPPLMRRG